jgi:hypothetical protein
VFDVSQESTGLPSQDDCFKGEGMWKEKERGGGREGREEKEKERREKEKIRGGQIGERE